MKLDSNKIRYIIIQKRKGRSLKDIADSFQILCRRVQQICKEFMDSRSIPSIKKAERKRIEISELARATTMFLLMGLSERFLCNLLSWNLCFMYMRSELTVSSCYSASSMATRLFFCGIVKLLTFSSLAKKYQTQSLVHPNVPCQPVRQLVYADQHM